MSRRLTLLFAVAAGIAVGNLYWAQPLLAEIARSFAVDPGQTGLLITLTQVGYGTGILFIVPLGDSVNRKYLIPLMMVLASLCLLGVALSPTYLMLALLLGSVGLTSIGGQLLAPLGGELAQPEHRGQVIGSIASGILTGILLSRTISGLLSDWLGWRAIFILAAIASLFIAALLYLRVPADRVRETFSYRALFTTLASLVKKYPVVRGTLLIGALVFGVFSLFWTGLTFLLSTAPYHYSLSQIGLVGIAGLAGALMAKSAGRFHDKGQASIATGIALIVLVGALALADVAAYSIVWLMIAVIVLDGAVQTINVMNQTRLISFHANARSRLNSLFVAVNFAGGAIGSALAGILWSIAGWHALMVAGGGATLVALFFWLYYRDAFCEPS